MRWTILLPALCLAACGPAVDEPLPDEVAVSREEAAVEQQDPQEQNSQQQAPTTLAGSWRVAELDDELLDDFVALELFANSRLIYWEPACAGMERHYSIDGTEFAASAVPSDGPKIICDIGLPDRIEDVFAAIDQADRIQPADGGGVLLSGLRHRLLLVPA